MQTETARRNKIEIEIDDTLVYGNIRGRHGQVEVRLVRVFGGNETIAKIDGLIFAKGFFPLDHETGKDLRLEDISKTEVFFLPSEPITRFGNRIRLHRSPSHLGGEWTEITVGRDSRNAIPDGAYVAVWQKAKM